MLNEELKRRKIEAEGLKKEQKKRRKDRLKEKEAALSKQIEVKSFDIHKLCFASNPLQLAVVMTSFDPVAGL